MELSDIEKKALASLQRQCVRREYCRSDIYSKALKLAEGDKESAARLVESLVRERFVDDLRYAGAFAREKASLNGWGKLKISYMLAAKGIDRQAIASALEDVDEESSRQKLEALVRSKARSLSGDPDRKLKTIKFALSRGYGYDEVRAAVENIDFSQDPV